MIIALTGYARSGKNTVARLIAERAPQYFGRPVVEIAFADPMKDFCRNLFGFDEEQLYGDARERPDPRWTRPDGTPLTARYALQTLGTEWGRNCDPDIWLKVGINRAKRAVSDGKVVVITDCRFLNESAAVKAAGGHVWRIKRGECQHTHPSEQFIWSDDMRPDVEIDNSGTIEQLQARVTAAILLKK